MAITQKSEKSKGIYSRLFIYGLVLNGILLGTYVAVAAWLRMPRSEGYALNGNDMVFYGAVALFPALVVGLVINGLWLVLIVKRRECWNRLDLLTWAASVGGWILLTDLDRSVIGILRLFWEHPSSFY